ncbi:MAG TPA: M28 family peptidase [Pyrinomonadaceae bacterium]|nr:M28 family peptidase [Pyrinomonadaceae bacterium]
MKVARSQNAELHSRQVNVADAFANVSTDYLSNAVYTISVPRHAVAEPGTNAKIAAWIKSELESFGYDVRFQGEYDNVVAIPPKCDGPFLLVGAHYDSVPACPGADDNASAVAVLLMCAKAISRIDPSLPVCFVAFNREEDGFLGSADFVRNYLGDKKGVVAGCHILEMVGYSSDEKGSQKLPPGLPINLPDTGNFLGVLGNHKSVGLVDGILSAGKSYVPDFEVIGLKLFLGAERLIPNLNRSDHVPFWAAGIPATMWTDTADFRNPNYHRPTDTPDTLSYGFMAKVTKLLIASLMIRESA